MTGNLKKEINESTRVLLMELANTTRVIQMCGPITRAIMRSHVLKIELGLMSRVHYLSCTVRVPVEYCIVHRTVLQ
jgi:hypothetical protein